MVSRAAFAKGDAVTVRRRPQGPVGPPQEGPATVRWASPRGDRYEVLMDDESASPRLFYAFAEELEPR